MRAHILFLGLDDAVAAGLQQALDAASYTVASAPFTDAAVAAAHVSGLVADIVFCDSEPRKVRHLMEALRAHGCIKPVIVASRLPEVGRWLDAMDAGAWDYCAAPFEPLIINHILEGALHCPGSFSYCPVVSRTTAPLA